MFNRPRYRLVRKGSHYYIQYSMFYFWYITYGTAYSEEFGKKMLERLLDSSKPIEEIIHG